MTRLCLAGGVAHNSALAGTIARTEQFREIFVHPASHDAGCAIGAALVVDRQLSRKEAPRPLQRIRTSAWGIDLQPRYERDLDRWGDHISMIRHGPALVDWAVEVLSAGNVLSWVQGRAEFGPRALGHRSVLADPRARATRDLINAKVKHREDFRPFAPVVRGVDVNEYFVVPPGIDCSFMSYVLEVRPQWRNRLEAVTHVDGTARVQSLDADQEPRLWSLLGRFGEATGVAVLLNTSLNVAGEPIVQTVDDLVEFLLSTGLAYAACEDCQITADCSRIDTLAVVLPADLRLLRLIDIDGIPRYSAERGGPQRARTQLSSATFTALESADGVLSVRDLASTAGVEMEVLSLWRRRFLHLLPANTTYPGCRI